MHYKAFLGLALIGKSIASVAPPMQARDVASLSTLKALIKSATEGVNDLDSGVKALTADNAKTQLKAINTVLMKISTNTASGVARVKSSGSIGITEVLGLASESGRTELLGLGTGLVTAINSTAGHIGAKLDIIKGSGAVDTIVPGIRAQKQPILDLIAIGPSQIPSALKSTINSALSQFMAGAANSSSSATATTGSSTASGSASPAKGKGKSTGLRGGAPKGSAGGSTSGASGIDGLLTPERLEMIGTLIDGIMDQIIAVLKGEQESFTLPSNLPALPSGLTLPSGLNLPGLSSPGTAATAKPSKPASVEPSQAAPTTSSIASSAKSPKTASSKAAKAASSKTAKSAPKASSSETS